MVIKKRRVSAYRFLKKAKLIVSGRGKIITLDLAMLPEDVNVNEFLKNWIKNNKGVQIY